MANSIWQRRRPRSTFRPWLEILEDRTVPALMVTTASDLAIHTGVSLRDAIAQANITAAGGISETITFDTVQMGGSTITLNQGQLVLSGAGAGTITIDGGSNPITINGNNASRVFKVDGGVQAIFNGLTIQGGATPNDIGAGVLNSGILTVTSATLSGNAADNGGGIYNTGTLTLSNVTVIGNSANTSPTATQPRRIAANSAAASTTWER